MLTTEVCSIWVIEFFLDLPFTSNMWVLTSSASFTNCSYNALGLVGNSALFYPKVEGSWPFISGHWNILFAYIAPDYVDQLFDHIKLLTGLCVPHFLPWSTVCDLLALDSYLVFSLQFLAVSSLLFCNSFLYLHVPGNDCHIYQWVTGSMTPSNWLLCSTSLILWHISWYINEK